MPLAQSTPISSIFHKTREGGGQILAAGVRENVESILGYENLKVSEKFFIPFALCVEMGGLREK